MKRLIITSTVVLLAFSITAIICLIGNTPIFPSEDGFDSSSSIFGVVLDENITSISVYFYNYWLKSPQLKEITNQDDIELVKKQLEQIQYDTSAEDNELYGGGSNILVVLQCADGSQQLIQILALGEQKILFYPNNSEQYRGMWLSADDFWDSLDYPVTDITWDEWP